jgi:hypothetical protein
MNASLSTQVRGSNVNISRTAAAWRGTDFQGSIAAMSVNTRRGCLTGKAAARLKCIVRNRQHLRVAADDGAASSRRLRSGVASNGRLRCKLRRRYQSARLQRKGKYSASATCRQASCGPERPGSRQLVGHGKTMQPLSD